MKLSDCYGYRCCASKDPTSSIGASMVWVCDRFIFLDLRRLCLLLVEEGTIMFGYLAANYDDIGLLFLIEPSRLLWGEAENLFLNDDSTVYNRYTIWKFSAAILNTFYLRSLKFDLRGKSESVIWNPPKALPLYLTLTYWFLGLLICKFVIVLFLPPICMVTPV